MNRDPHYYLISGQNCYKQGAFLPPMSGRNINLLSLDGGGVRGLSSLIILKEIMESIDRENPPKPCDYFDLIGGSGSGGFVHRLFKVVT